MAAMPEQTTVGETDPKAEAAAAAQVEAEQDAVLAQILDNEDETFTPERDGSGRFAKKTDSTAEDTDAGSKTDTPEPEPSDSVNPDDYRKAVKALQRDKVSQATLDKLDPQEIVDMAQGRAEAQATQDGFGNRLKSLEKLLKEAPKAQDTKAMEPEPIDVTDSTKEFAQFLRDEYGGDDASPAVQAFAQKLIEQVRATNNGQVKALAEQQAALDSIRTQFVEQQRRDARTDKSLERYKLSANDRWEKVIEYRGADLNEFPTEREGIEAACRQAFADEIIADYETKLSDQHKLRANGQPTIPGKTDTPSGSLDVPALEEALLNAIQDGDNPLAERISRKLGRRPQRGFAEAMLTERVAV